MRHLCLYVLAVFASCFGGESNLPIWSECGDDDGCAADLVCLYGRCRPMCMHSGDCDVGDCVVDREGRRLCVNIEIERTDDCPDCAPPNLCVAGQCMPPALPADGDADADADASTDGDADVEMDGTVDSDIPDDAVIDADMEAYADVDLFGCIYGCELGEDWCHLYCDPEHITYVRCRRGYICRYYDGSSNESCVSSPEPIENCAACVSVVDNCLP